MLGDSACRTFAGATPEGAEVLGAASLNLSPDVTVARLRRSVGLSQPRLAEKVELRISEEIESATVAYAKIIDERKISTWRKASGDFWLQSAGTKWWD
jgi:hypothetical protein